MPLHETPDEDFPCPECEAADWEMQYRRLPHVGWTRRCKACDGEAFVYDAGDMPGGPYHLRPVDGRMARYLLFAEATGDNPDKIIDEYRPHGLSEPVALDYHAIEKAGLSQSAWAEGVETIGQAAVSHNVNKAREKLEQTDD